MRALSFALVSSILATAPAAATPHGDALARFLDEAAAEETAENDRLGADQFRALAEIARRTGSIRREDIPKDWMEGARAYGPYAHAHARLLRLEQRLTGLHPAVADARPTEVAHAAVDLLKVRHELSEDLAFAHFAGAYLNHAQADLDSLGDDADGDGVLSAVDRCPDVAEDADDFQDYDGCPDPDNDGDGRPDVSDRCPREAEDADGFQDDDGCPDPDNDRDGIADAKDACPNAAETVNALADADGCPDVLKPVLFASDSARLDADAIDVLRDVAVAMGSGPARVRVEGHADSRDAEARNRALGQRRATAVRDYLVNVAGVAADRIETVSHGAARPVADNATEAGRAANRRAEFVILPAGT